jgi:hypothetical protein
MDKVEILRKFWHKHKDGPSQAAKSCPFGVEIMKNNTFACHIDGCLSIDQLHVPPTYLCPCCRFGVEEAMFRLNQFLVENQDHDYDRRIE